MNFLKYPLWPFSLVYAGITQARNILFDAAILKSVQFGVPVISVGNLTVGGTGKTPHVEYLVRLLNNKQIAILSRGYKRNTKGFVLGDSKATAETLGDEPFQYYQEFPDVTVAVCEDRVAGINQILTLKPQTEIILLDDAYQHRPVQPQLNILITDYNRLFYQDWVLPAGRLREGRIGANRADIIIVSKCPENLPETEKLKIKSSVANYSKSGTPVFFTRYKYQKPVGFGKQAELNKNIILVTGIAKADLLYNYLIETGYIIHKHYNFPDHYHYTEQDVEEISNFAGSLKQTNISVLTTQKDWTKLGSPDLIKQIVHLPLFYIPIEVQFLADKAAFDQLILKTTVKEPIV